MACSCSRPSSRPWHVILRFAGVIDREALALYLRHNYIPGPWSIYQGIRKLAPGAFVKLAFGKVSPPIGVLPEEEHYWSLREVIVEGRDRPFEGNAGQAVDALHDVLRQAVASQVVADVPLVISHWKSPASIVRHTSEPRTCLSDRRAWPDAPELESRLMGSIR